MAWVKTDDKHYKAIADAIRAKNEGTPEDVFRPSEMASAVLSAADIQYSRGEREGYNFGYQMGNEKGYFEGFQEGYDDGFVVGEESGLAEGKEQGKQEEYDRFWDMIQQNGARTAYEYAFMDWGWEYARAKYKIAPTDQNPIYTFAYNVKLKKVEAAYVDFSQLPMYSDRNTYVMRGFTRTFLGCSALEEIEDVGLHDRFYSMTFRSCAALRTIAKMRVSSGTMFDNAFYECSDLQNLTLEGEIGQNGLSLQYSTKLSKASIESVVNALSVSASGKSVTLSNAAVNNAFTADEWAALAATKSNWTINLI